MWHQLAKNPEVMKDVFRDETPSLEGVTLHKVAYVFNEYTDVLLTVNLPNYPQNPPGKWADREYNTVQVTLRLVGVLSTGLTAFGPSERINIKIDDKQNYLMLQATSDIVNFSVKFKWLYISAVTGMQQATTAA
ncbi:hypothetical protein GCM10023189_20190 [Nibrella saemangeumensis]|uniref:Immunity protein 50 n=1 Tax=Nibrella saemangeumensis TaxID=1084526 RepID=A0ABP8MTE0_9BACT